MNMRIIYCLLFAMTLAGAGFAAAAATVFQAEGAALNLTRVEVVAQTTFQGVKGVAFISGQTTITSPPARSPE